MTVLYYKERESGINLKLGEILTNHSFTVDEALDFLDVDMEKVASDNGWDGWNFESLELVEE